MREGCKTRKHLSSAWPRRGRAACEARKWYGSPTVCCQTCREFGASGSTSRCCTVSHRQHQTWRWVAQEAAATRRRRRRWSGETSASESISSQPLAAGISTGPSAGLTAPPLVSSGVPESSGAREGAKDGAKINGTEPSALGAQGGDSDGKKGTPPKLDGASNVHRGSTEKASGSATKESPASGKGAGELNRRHRKRRVRQRPLPMRTRGVFLRARLRVLRSRTEMMRVLWTWMQSGSLNTTRCRRSDRANKSAMSITDVAI